MCFSHPAKTSDSGTNVRPRYTCYESVITIVQNHYRSVGDECELDARRTLTSVLSQLAPDRTR